jgi:hypothetical protein
MAFAQGMDAISTMGGGTSFGAQADNVAKAARHTSLGDVIIRLLQQLADGVGGFLCCDRNALRRLFGDIFRIGPLCEGIFRIG